MGWGRQRQMKNTNIIERKILRRIFDPKKNTANNEYEQWTNAELKETFNEPDIVRILNS